MKRFLSPSLVFLLLIFLSGPTSIFAETTTWSKNSLNDPRLSSVVGTDTAIFAGSAPEGGGGYGGVLRSTDGGKTWERVGLAGGIVTALMIHDQMIYAGIYQSTTNFPLGLKRSTDNGTTWQTVGPALSVLSLTKQGTTLFAGMSAGRGIYRSSDGSNWTQVGMVGFSIASLAADNTAVFALARSSQSSSKDGLYRSVDGGNTWTVVALGSGEGSVYADKMLVLATLGSQLIRSTNSGASYQGVYNIPHVYTATLGPITSDGSNYYLGHRRILGGIQTGGVLRSTDQGLTWQPFSEGLNFTTQATAPISALDYVAKEQKLYTSASQQGLWEHPLGPSGLPPVVIIPGFSGTEFIHKDTGEVRWVDIAEQVKSQTDDFLDVLKLQDDSKTSEDGSWLSGLVIEKIDLPHPAQDIDFYDSLKKSLMSLGYKENANLFLFGYDWRRDLANNGWPSDLVSTETKLNNLISNINNRVVLITHSTGGLIASQYIQNPAQASKIQSLISLASPWKGTVAPFLLLHYGQSFIPHLNKSKAQQLANNFPTVYELLPTRRFFGDYSTYFIDQTDRDGDGNMGPLNYEQMHDLLGKMHNPNALAIADAFSTQNVGDWSNGTNGVKVYNVVGTGLGTPGVVREWYEKDLFGNQHRKQSYNCIDGDNTVPFHSADLANTPDQSVYYVHDTEHSQMPSSSVVHELIKNILLNQPVQVTDDLTRAPTKTFSGTCVKVFSPVSLHIYDDAGNHNGPIESGDIERTIPGSVYDILDESKMAILPSGRPYRIELHAEQTGTFDLAIENIASGSTEQTTFFNDVPITTASTSAQLQLDNQGTISPLIIDQDGNGSVDTDRPPDSTTSSVEDTTPPVTEINLSGIRGKNGWFTSTIQTTLSASDASGSGVLKTIYKIDDSLPVDYTQPFALNRENISTIAAQSIDKVGNTEDPVNGTVKIDTLPPIITIDSPQEETFLQGQTVKFSFAATDATSGVASLSALLNSQSITNGQTVILDKLGNQIFSLQAEDWAGHKQTLTLGLNVLFQVAADFKPDTFWLRGRGAYVSVYLTMPTEYSADEVNISSVTIEGVIPTITKPKVIKKINKQRKQLRVDFNRQAFADFIRSKNPKDKENITFKVLGKIIGGIGFQGTASVVIRL